MKLLKYLKGLILPETIDFFGELFQQSKMTANIITALKTTLTHKDNQHIRELISIAKKSRKEKLKRLEKVFITPIDREAISASYNHLYWIALSVEHLTTELEIYQIQDLTNYQKILNLLLEEIQYLTLTFELLKEKKYHRIVKKVNHVIHLDNVLISEHTLQLNSLFNEKDRIHILQHREILAQLKEISKRMHFCANQIEYIVFKVN